MIRITIGIAERIINSIHDLEENWINQQVNRRQNDGQPVCVKVSIELDSINIHLCTPACTVGRGGEWQPNQKEQEIYDIWKKNGLNKNEFSGGNVVAFFKQLTKLIN